MITRFLKLVSDDVRRAVSSAVVHTVQAPMPLVCEPIEQKRRRKVIVDAQFNVALGLTANRFRSGTSTRQKFAVPEIRRLMDLTGAGWTRPLTTSIL